MTLVESLERDCLRARARLLAKLESELNAMRKFKPGKLREDPLFKHKEARTERLRRSIARQAGIAVSS